MGNLKEKTREKETKSFTGVVVGSDDDSRVVKQYFAVYGNVDNVGDKMFNGAFAKSIKERKSQIKVLWQHDATQPPIGVPLVIEEHDRDRLPRELLERYPEATGGLYGEVKYLDTPRGNEVYVGIKEGAITENSIGYSAIKQKREREYRGLMECKLYDISPVNWGANPATLNLKTIDYVDVGKDERNTYEKPTLTDFTEFKWDELEIEQSRIASHYALATDDTFEGLLFPHHDPAVEGTGPVVLGGLKLAMKSLLLGEVDVDDTDRRAVYDHLVKHYNEFNIEPPKYELIELSRYARSLAGDVKYADLLEELERKLRAEPSITTLTPVDDLYLKWRLMEHI